MYVYSTYMYDVRDDAYIYIVPKGRVGSIGTHTSTVRSTLSLRSTGKKKRLL